MTRRLLYSPLLLLAVCAGSHCQTVDHPLPVGGEVKAPKALKHPLPYAPVNCGNGSEEGETTIAIVVNEKGHVARAQLATSSGSAEFDKDALKTAKQYEFEPATLDGHPVAVQMNIAMNYRSHRVR